MNVCPAPPPVFSVVTPWDGPLWWLAMGVVSGLCALFWRRLYRRQLAQVRPPPRQRLAVGLYTAYMLTLLAFEGFDILVILPSLVRQHAWFQLALVTCRLGALPNNDDALYLLLAAMVGAGVVTAGVGLLLRRLNHRLGLPTWQVDPAAQRPTDTEASEAAN